MSRLPAVQSLNRSRVFASAFLSSDERAALIGATLPTRVFGAGREVSNERERAGPFHVVIDGWACRYRTTRDGSRQILALLTGGDVANLDATLLGPIEYGIRALSAARVVTIPRERMAALIDQHVGIAKTLAWLAMVENLTLSRWVLRLGRQSAKQQLAHLLCEIHQRLNLQPVVGGVAVSFDSPLSQEDMADVLGLTSVHVSRTLRQLRDAGLLSTKGRSIAIHDIAALREFAEFEDEK